MKMSRFLLPIFKRAKLSKISLLIDYFFYRKVASRVNLSRYVAFSLIIASCFSFVKLNAQEGFPVQQSFQGFFENYADRYGNEISLEQLKIVKQGPAKNYVDEINVGQISVYFESGSGFEDPLNPEHQQRRLALEHLLSTIQQVILFQNQSDRKLNIRVRPYSNELYSTPVMASSFYRIPSEVSEIISFEECIASQIINGNKDQIFDFSNGSTKAEITSNEICYSHIDISVDFSENWNVNLIDTELQFSEMDLYTFLLREFTCALGVNSFLGKAFDGSDSKLLSRLDNLLYDSNQNKVVLQNSLTKYYFLNPSVDINFTLHLSSTICDGISDSLVFLCIENLPAYKLYSGTCYKDGISQNYLSEYSNTSSVLKYSTEQDVEVLRRLSALDVQVLNYLGYSLNGCGGDSNFQTDFCSEMLTLNYYSSAHLLGSTNLSTPEVILTKDETSAINLELYLNADQINNIDFIYPAIDASCNVVRSGNTIELTPTQSGFGLLPISVYGKINYMVFYVLKGGGSNCVVECNLVGNPSFEESDIPCGTFFPAGTGNQWPNVNVDCWSRYSTSPDLFSTQCNISNVSFPAGSSLPPGPNNTAAVRLFSRVTTQTFEEGIQAPLVADLIPGLTYTVTFIARKGNPFNASYPLAIPYLRVYFRSGEFLAGNNSVNLTLDPGLNEVGGTYVTDEGVWNEYSFDFVCPAGVLDLDHVVITSEWLGDNDSWEGRWFFIDDVNIQVAPTIDLPTSICSQVVLEGLEEFVTPEGGTFDGEGVSQIGDNWNFQPTSIGQYVINYSLNTCQEPISDVIQVFEVSFNQANIHHVCQNQCNGWILPSLSTNGITADLQFLWSGPNGFTASTQNIYNLCAGTYTLTVIVNGECEYSNSYFVNSLISPSATFTTSNNICASSICNGSIAVVTSASNSISWNIPAASGFNPTNLCSATYIATISNSQGCSTTLTIPVVSPSVNSFTNLAVSTTQSINISNQSYGTITVQSGGNLTLFGNSSGVIGNLITVQAGARLKIMGTLEFFPNARIVVNPGGRLFLEQAVLTSHCPNTYWLGIEVQGSNAYSQNDISQSMVAGLASPVETDGQINQGGIHITKNSIISFADIGVKLHSGNSPFFGASNSGGYIRADESTFQNNRRDISFATYGTNSFSNLSKFIRMRFEVNSDQLNVGNPLGPRVTLVNTNKVAFSGCQWVNTSAVIASGNTIPNVSSQHAVYLKNASCIIDHISNSNSTYPSKIHGFIYGVFIQGSYLSHPVSVANTEFRCYRGCLAGQVANGSEFSNNDFYELNSAPSISTVIPLVFQSTSSTTPSFNNYISLLPSVASGPSYGIYLDACGATDVEGNLFNIQGASNVQRVGLYVNNCNDSFVNIKENAFRMNTFGIRFLNDNRTSNAAIDGTTFSCNEFENNDRHVEINASSQQLTTMGINQNIYSNLITSLGNQFNGTTSLFASNRFIFDNVGGLHSFRGKQSEVSYINNQMGGLTFNANYNVNTSINCGNNNSNTTVSGLMNNMLAKQQALVDYKDDGNPGYFEYLIDGIDASNLISRYNELINVSPALSPERIIELLDKESEIPRPLLLDVLLTNISSLKNGDVLIKLESLEQPLSVWEKDSIYSSFFNVDAKEQLEIELDIAKREAYSKIQDEFMFIYLDTNNVDVFSALEEFKENLAILTENRSLLIEAQNQFEWNDLNHLIDEKLGVIKEDAMEYKDLVTLQNLVNEAKERQLSLSSELENYDYFADAYLLRDYPLTYRMAALITNRFDSVEFHGDLDYAEGIVAPRSLQYPKTNLPATSFKILPNPAKDFVRIQSNDHDLMNCNLAIKDVSGRNFTVNIISKTRTEAIVDLAGFDSGTYFIEVLEMDRSVSTHKLIITK